MTEEERLRECLTYLASCQAATLENLPKSASKMQRVRHTGLANIARIFLRGGRPPRASGLQHTIDRLDSAIAEHGL